MTDQRKINIIKIILLHIVAIFYAAPFLYAILTSFKSLEDIVANTSFLPQTWYFANYVRIFEKIPFLLYFKNTLVFSVATAIGAIFSSSFIAYGFTKLRWKGQDVVFFVYLAMTTMIPPIVLTIPMYKIYASIHLTNTYFPLIAPTFLGVAFYVFIFRQFFRGIPDAFLEAARMEGAREVKIYYSVVLLMSKPAIFVVGVFQFFGSWNNFDGPLIYLSENTKYPLALGLQALQHIYTAEWHMIMVGAVLVALLPVAVYGYFQKSLTEGLTFSGLK